MSEYLEADNVEKILTDAAFQIRQHIGAKAVIVLALDEDDGIFAGVEAASCVVSKIFASQIRRVADELEVSAPEKLPGMKN